MLLSVLVIGLVLVSHIGHPMTIDEYAVLMGLWRAAVAPLILHLPGGTHRLAESKRSTQVATD